MNVPDRSSSLCRAFHCFGAPSLLLFRDIILQRKGGGSVGEREGGREGGRREGREGRGEERGGREGGRKGGSGGGRGGGRKGERGGGLMERYELE